MTDLKEFFKDTYIKSVSIAPYYKYRHSHLILKAGNGDETTISRSELSIRSSAIYDILVKTADLLVAELIEENDGPTNYGWFGGRHKEEDNG